MLNPKHIISASFLLSVLLANFCVQAVPNPNHSNNINPYSSPVPKTAPTPTPVPACLSYQGPVTLEGELEQVEFPGPPHYTDPDHGDKLQPFWFLKLAKPVCIDVDTVKPDLNMAQTNQDLFEIEVNQEMYNKYNSRIGKQVQLTGTLFGAIGLHHHTPVVIDNVEFLQK
jgi:hypothetical protein